MRPEAILNAQHCMSVAVSRPSQEDFADQVISGLFEIECMLLPILLFAGVVIAATLRAMTRPRALVSRRICITIRLLSLT